MPMKGAFRVRFFAPCPAFFALRLTAGFALLLVAPLLLLFAVSFALLAAGFFLLLVAGFFLLFAVVSVFFFIAPQNTPTQFVRQLGKSLHVRTPLCGTLLRDFQRCLTLVSANASDREIMRASCSLPFSVRAAGDRFN